MFHFFVSIYYIKNSWNKILFVEKSTVYTKYTIYFNKFLLKWMHEQKQIFKICRVCGYEREYDNFHRLYVACKKCASIRCAK